MLSLTVLRLIHTSCGWQVTTGLFVLSSLRQKQAIVVANFQIYIDSEFKS